MNLTSKQYSRRDILSYAKKGITVTVVAPPLISLLYSLPSAEAQTSQLLVPKATITPDMSTGEWLPGEWEKDSLEVQLKPGKGIPSGAKLPYMRLKHDSDNLYMLSDLILDTTLQNDINVLSFFDTAHDGLTWNKPDDFGILSVLKGSGSSPSNYHLVTTPFYSVPDFEKVKSVWSFNTSMYNQQQKHVIIKEAIPISALKKYQSSNAAYGFKVACGNTSRYAVWPDAVANSTGDLSLSEEVAVDFFPPGMQILAFITSILGVKFVPKAYELFRRFLERKTELAK